ncbi:MAG TPA: efflux RND transporter periplasmic adaptor subunit, partial [Candidatus Deferrimicrobium sp.]|nr:efflux RND transporter periplasmic adaptor subunit [Candidatus Deferrimicrobium sp.]
MTDARNEGDIASLKIDRDRKYSDRPKSRRWRYILYLIVAGGIILAYLQFKERITPATQVKLATATIISPTDARSDLVATGYVVAQRKAEVASKGTGRLVYLGFEEGDKVSKGEVIGILDNEDIKANLELAKAGLVKAEADSLEAARSYRRAKELYASGSIRQTELETAETSYKLAVAGVTAAAANVRATQVAFENTYIRAPFDGTILTKNADVGEIVAPFASSASSKGSVVTMADMTSLEVEADVSESNIQKVRTGQQCEIVLDAYPETRYPGS